MVSHSLPQGIFLTQVLNLLFLYWQVDSLPLSHQGKVKVKVTQSCPNLCNSMDCIACGILQARILEWVAFPFSRGSSQPRDRTLPQCRQILYQLSHKGSPRIWGWVFFPFSRDLPDPGIKPGSPTLQVDSLPTELSEIGRAHV